MRREIEIAFAADQAHRWVLAPRPFDHWGQRFTRFEASGVSDVAEVQAENSSCRGYLLRLADGAARLTYAFEVGETSDPAFAAPDWTWRVDRNRYTSAAPSLVELAQRLAIGATSERAALRRIIEDAAGVFGYGHVDEPFNAGSADVPMICGVTKGSCVDINTYLLAAALSVGLKGQYVAGYWFHPHKTETRDMHCWLAFEADGALVFWDLAHALKWGDTLGAEIREGLNPAGGRRIAMSCGRGLAFATPMGRTVVSHFAEPIILGADGAQIRPDLHVALREDEAEPPQEIDARAMDGAAQ